MKRILKSWIVPILLLFLVIIFTYSQLVNSFYEQDEWLGLGNYLIGQTNKFCINTEKPLGILIGEGRQLSALITCFSYNHFPFNTTPLVVYRILIHFINSVLVFILIKKVLDQTIPALTGALFFAVNSVSQGAVTWFAAHGTLPATTMVIIALLAFLKCIGFNEKDKEGLNKKWLSISIIALYVSLLFKQIAIFMFLLFPLAALIYTLPVIKRKLLNNLPKKYILFFLIFVVFMAFWIIKFQSITGSNALFLTGSNSNFYQTLLLRSIFYPLTSFSLGFVPPEPFLNFARYVTNIYYPFFSPEQFNLIVQTVVLDMLAVLLSTLLFVLLFLLNRRTNENNKKVIWFFVLFSLVSFLPYVLISKSFGYLESRYYYLSAVSSAFIVGWLINTIWVASKKFGGSIILLTFLFVTLHAMTVYKDIGKQVNLSYERKHFLTQLTEVTPDLNDKSIFFITGSDDFYLPGNKVPFQNGFGHSLAVWYYHTGKIPRELVKNGKLFEIGSQGYYEYGELGFGYFSSREALKETMDRYNLPPSVIIALYYDAENKNLVDIIDKTLEELRGAK